MGTDFFVSAITIFLIILVIFSRKFEEHTECFFELTLGFVVSIQTVLCEFLATRVIDFNVSQFRLLFIFIVVFFGDFKLRNF